MATVEQVRKVILDVAGNPASGVVADFATEWAERIVAIDAPKVKETRVVNSAEKR